VYTKLVAIISIILLLSTSQGLPVSQDQIPGQSSYNIELNKNYAWKVTGEGEDVKEDFSFVAEINIMITQFDPEMEFTLDMTLLSGSYPQFIPIDRKYGGWIWDNEIWDFPQTPATFNQLIYPTDSSFWNSRFGISNDIDGLYIMNFKDDLAIFSQGFIDFTGTATDSYSVNSDTGILQIYQHKADLTSNRNNNDIFNVYFSIEFKGSKVTAEDNNFIDIMNVTLTSKNINLYTTISWGIIIISLIGIITLNIRYYLSRNKNL